MKKWLYKNKVIENLKDLPNLKLYQKGWFGFTYVITHIKTEKKYIGRKNFFTKRNVKLGKKEIIKLKEERKLLKMRGKVPSKKLVIKESDWVNYWGSNKELLKFIKIEGKDKFTRKILELAYNKKHLTYLETKQLFKNDVLEKEEYFNDNIQARFFSKDFEFKNPLES